MRVDGKVVANNWDDLTDGTLDLKIDVTENNTNAGGTNDVWTNVAADGSAVDIVKTCLEWQNNTGGQQARVGLRGSVDQKWTNDADKGCNGAKHLYCFET